MRVFDCALRRACVAAGLIAIVAPDMQAHAGTRATTLSVSATVEAQCSVFTTPLAFGGVDTNASALALGVVDVTCSPGATATLTLDQGTHAAPGSSDFVPLRQMSDGGGRALPYGLFSDPARTTPWGNTSSTGKLLRGTGGPQSLSVYGAIEAGFDPPPGAYADSVVVTVAF